MIKNIVFDVGNVMVTEMGAKLFPYLSTNEQKELNNLVYKSEGFTEAILGKQTTKSYKNYLLKESVKYHKEINILLSPESMSLALPKKPEMIDLAYSLKYRFKIYFLSDMLDITFDYLEDFLENFDGGVYSYQEHSKKPYKEFYEILYKRYNIEPKESIFFDDKLRNIDVAKELGMQAVLFTNINDVKQALNC